MTKQQASKLLSENLTAIYGYAFARLYDKEDVEDLTGEIVCQVLSSAERLEKEESFWGFVWKIAENTFRKFLKQKAKQALPTEDTDPMGETAPSAEDSYLSSAEESEELFRLRRELALLTKTNLSASKWTVILRKTSTIVYALHASLAYLVITPFCRTLPNPPDCLSFLITLGICLAVSATVLFLEKFRLLRWLKYAH